MIHLEINNTPTPWSPARVTPRGAFNPKGSQKRFTMWQIKSMYRGNPISGYVVLEFTFIFQVPASFSTLKKKRCLENVSVLPTKCDCTNLQKFYEDCLKGIVIDDDRYVAKISSKKLYGEKEKILINIFTLEEYRKKNEDHNR